MKMKAAFLNCIISILLTTLIIAGTITGMASALDGQLGNDGDSDTVKSSNGNSNTKNSSTGESGGDENYSSSSNSSGVSYTYSEELDYNDSEELDYNDSEELEYNDSEELDYNDSEEYFTDDESYTYDFSSSGLDVVIDLYWMGIDVIEPASNIYAKELVIRNVMGGYPARFDFVENTTCITDIEFDPLMTFRKTITTAEVLKGISVFVQELPTGRIYQYTDIFVGDKEAGLPTHLKNGLVGFKVEKSWIKDNNVNESLVTLQWYNNSWEPLYTEKVGEDNNYVYFESKTPGFSFFVITELNSVSSMTSAPSVQSASPTNNETQITTSGLAINPAIYGDRVVWQDNRSGNDDIYMYDIITFKETPVTTSGSDHESLAIYGDRIVWEDWRNGNGDIYMYDIATSKETLVTTSGSDHESPAIYGDRVVWQDNRSGNDDIYMYDIVTSKETQVTTSGSAYSPAIYGDRIVWEDWRNENGDIYMYDFSTKTETQITTNESDQEFPAIYGDRIVWQDNRSGNWDIYMYDIATSTETQIITNEYDQVGPSIYGDSIVWEDWCNGSSDIYMCNLSSIQSKPNTQVFEQNSTETNVEQTPEQTQSPNTSGKESTKVSGFEIISGIICLLSVFMYKRR